MPDKRRHRGPHPEDRTLFAEAAVAVLSGAAADLVWLRNREYALDASLKLVGDRYQLRARQRMALLRGVCTDAARAARASREASAATVAGRALRIDGFNVLTTVEAALGGGLVIHARDGCYRDLASVHGSYRKIAETERAIELVGESLADVGIAEVTWYLDTPVSNSGRLRGVLLEVAAARNWPWTVELAMNPDAELRQPGACIATADSGILDAAGEWLNLARLVVDTRIAGAWILRLFA
jgi:hypothetical protein